MQSYAGGIIDLLKLCTSSSCVVAGNTGGRTLNKNVTVSSTATITSFWGSFGSYSGKRCLETFGMTLLSKSESDFFPT